MASSLVVLVPNGRRQTVKVNPNTTILQVLEEACRKHGFNPEEYDIKHHRKILDTTTTIRFSGLPNNAQLELVQGTTTRKESEVILMIQCEDGKRFTGNFSPGMFLWDILLKLCPDETTNSDSVVLIYTRNEIIGETNLKVTNLKSIGLTGGRAMMRLIHRLPEELRVQANVSASLPNKPVEEKPYIRQFQPISEPESKPQSFAEPEAKSQSFSSTDNSQKTNIKPETPIKSEALNLERTQKHKESFNPLRAIRQEKQKQTEGLTTKNIADSEKVVDNSEESLVFLGERNAILFSYETSQNVQSDDLPDDFFELSIKDVKKLFRDIKKARLEMETANLMTSAMRDLENSKKQLRQLNQYKKTIIRVQFPTRIVLQGIFTPVETILHVINFIKDYLEDKSMQFYLFTTPPKSVLSPESTLLESGCVPGALLYFGSELKHDTYLKKDILEKLTTSSAASSVATKTRKENKRTLNNDEDDDVTMEDLLASEVNQGASTSANTATVYEDYDKKVNAAPAEKVPKWFKPTK